MKSKNQSSLNGNKTPIYTISDCTMGKFISRANRFVCEVEIDGTCEMCHLHDPGRLRELLISGATMCLRRPANIAHRSTKYDIIWVTADNGKEVLINSSLHRYISQNLLSNPDISPFGKSIEITPEVKIGQSRLDYRIVTESGDTVWIEVKGVSLTEDEIAMFPDAPSERAVRHLYELMEIRKSGKRAAVLLLIFRDSYAFRPRIETDPKFHKAFYEALDTGVEVYPVQFELKDNTIYYVEKKIEILK